MKAYLVCCLVVLAGLSLPATEKPNPSDLKGYVQDGTYEKRARFVKELGNHRVRKDLAQRMLSRLRRAAAPQDGPLLAPLPNLQGMPTKGTNKVLVLLIDFPDYNHVNDASLVSSKLFGDGIPSEFPSESLRNYYRRSSYNQLEIQGSALGWYRMLHPRNWYTTNYAGDNEANRAVILEALQAFDATHDFSQYDNNGDGEVDYFAVIWAGPDNGWGNFWWGYQWDLYNPITMDGVRFSTFSWQWESRPVGSAFEASTIIHETGHALGLPDYYDYDPNLGPDGGVGGLDIMDGDRSDHNAFSKFMLEWLEPVGISGGATNITLKALGGSPEAVTVMPNLVPGTPYSEYFLVENRTRTNNDAFNYGDGVLIWHIDATPNARGEDFLYDNSYTEHKLIRLMEADGLEEIEKGNGNADSSDYWTQGKAFSSSSSPNSRAYDGSVTGVAVDSISVTGQTMAMRVAVEGVATGPRIQRSPESLSQSTMEDTAPPSQNLRIWATGGTLSYAISDDAPWLSVSPASGSSSGPAVTNVVSYSVAGLEPGTYDATITITAPGATNSPQIVSVTLTVMGNDIGEALDANGFAWTSGGPSLWFEQTSMTHDYQDAAQSGSISHNQTNWIETTVQGPGLLSFWWKVSSEANYDYLRFLVDGAEAGQKISGATEWQKVSKVIAPGQHTVRWAYTKDEATVSGADAGWVDEFEFVPGDVPPSISCTASLAQMALLGQNGISQQLQIENGGGGVLMYSISSDAWWLAITPENEASSGAPNTHIVSYNTSTLPAGTHTANITVTAPGANNSPKVVPVTLKVVQGGGALADAVDFPTAIWTTGGSGLWTPVTGTTYDGQDAVMSPDIAADQVTWIETTLQGPGTLSFWWKISSEENYDYLDLLIDGEYTGIAIDGEVNWRHDTAEIPSGTHTVKWAYSKDGNGDSGLDAAWLDQVVFTSGGNLPETILSADFSGGLPAGWQVVDNAFTGAIWRFDDPCNTGNLTGGSGVFAIADSDCAGEVSMDTELITPVMDFTGFTNVVLEFKSDLAVFSSEIAEVDYRLNGGSWNNLWRRASDDYGPRTYRLRIPDADNQYGLEIRFHYWNAYYDLMWSIDDVKLTAVSTLAPPSDFAGAWRQVWDAFDRNYARFVQKNINWGPVFEANRASFAVVSDESAFAAKLSTVLGSLGDWQVKVKQPDGTWVGYNGNITNNFPPQPFTSYTAGTAYTDLNNAGVIQHALVYGTLAHIVVNTLEDEPWSLISNANLEALFQTYKNAEGVLLDLRPTADGNITNAIRVASRFTDLPRVYGYTQTRAEGVDHAAFGQFMSRLLQPSSGTHFTNKVACLVGHNTTGAAEWLTLMMKVCPQVMLIGDRTRGSAGATELFSQSDLNVDYVIPRELAYDTDQVCFQDRGILPQLLVTPATTSYSTAAQRDYVLERGIAWLRRPSLNARPLISTSGLAVDWHSGTGSTYTLLTTTNILEASWQLAPGTVSNRPGTGSLLSYTNSSAGPRQFYRIQVGP